MRLEAEYPVDVSHPEKLLWEEAGITKLDYIHYLIQVAPWFLPHLRDRPVTVIRCPDGVGEENSFYQKDAPPGTPEWVTTVPLWSPDRHDYIHYVMVDKVATLIWLGNLAAVEMHIGFATLYKPHLPTHIVFDLDPTVPGFQRVRDVALALHRLLDTLDLPNVVKTSGATGLQVFIPVVGGLHFDDTRIFTEAVAKYLAARLPDTVTLERLKKHRSDKVYVDYLQHGPGRTLIAPYSARGTPAATVSTPLLWSEVQAGCVPEDFTIRTTPGRLEHQGDVLAAANPVSLQDILRFLKERGSEGFL